MELKDPVCIENFSYKYDSAASPAVEDISLSIKSGECVLITGRSGCGKTSLMRCINGLVPHFYEGMKGGKVYVYGTDVAEVPIHSVSEKIGSVFQDPRSQFFTTNTTNEIAFGLENTGVEPETMKKRISDVAADLSLTELLGRQVFDLSSGEKQKIAIASVYAMDPSIIIFDEPSANLDIPSIYRIVEMIKKFKAAGHTVIIIEHRLFFLTELIDRVLYIDEGRIIEDTDVRTFLSLSEAQMKERGLRSFDLIGLNIKNSESRFIAGQGLPEAEAETPVLEVRGLNVTIDKKNILADINFEAYPGEIIGIIGTNGSGKTTLVKTLCGLIREKSGTVMMHGFKAGSHRERMKHTFYVMQDSDYQLFSETVNNELMLGSGKNDNLQQQIDDLLKKMGLYRYRKRHPSALSRGEKQRLTIAVSVIMDHDIQFFDEPTSGLDRDSMDRIAELLFELKSRGKTLIVISHDYEFIMNTCCRIIHIRKGRLVDSFPLTAGTKTRLLAAGGLSSMEDIKSL